MKASKVLIILGIVFAILYSCAIQKKPTPAFKEVVKPLVIVKKDTIKEIHYRYQQSFQTPERDISDKREVSDNLSLKKYIDSLMSINSSMFKSNNRLTFEFIINQQRMLKDREALLIERENREKLQKENAQIKTVTKLSDNYMAIFLATGIVVNTIMTMGLYFYKKRQLQKLKKYNFIHA